MSLWMHPRWVACWYSLQIHLHFHLLVLVSIYSCLAKLVHVKYTSLICMLLVCQLSLLFDPSYSGLLQLIAHLHYANGHQCSNCLIYLNSFPHSGITLTYSLNCLILCKHHLQIFWILRTWGVTVLMFHKTCFNCQYSLDLA